MNHCAQGGLFFWDWRARSARALQGLGKMCHDEPLPLSQGLRPLPVISVNGNTHQAVALIGDIN
jgi:hypothetical protein